MPIFCKSPQYRKYKPNIIQYLYDQLRHNGVVEGNYGTWGVNYFPGAEGQTIKDLTDRLYLETVSFLL